ncbi:MAG: hypothetical protein HY996_00555, partial [Micrococcales bacterium]|nr:hypothetical protein [Micrococcales bacterium]
TDWDTDATIPRYYVQVHASEREDPEPNDTTDTARGPYAASFRECGQISPAQDTDLYAVTVGQGADLRAETLADDGAVCPTDTILELVGTDGLTLLAEDDDDGADTCSLIDPAAAAGAANLPAGTYFLRVRGYGEASGPTVLDVMIIP